MNDGTLKFDTAIDSSGFQKGINSIGSIAQKGLAATAAILTATTAAIGGLGVAAIKIGSDFEGAMSTVEAISGATGDELAALTEKAKEMGATTKFSATESANAFEYMAMAGWKTEDMLSGIEGIMNLAAASGEDLATTSDILTDALTAFGMQASESAHFADVLAAASSNANTNVSMMGETFKYVAPVAGALGFTAEDTAIAIGLMANAGIKSSQAGTSLRSMMSRLAKPTKEVQNAMNALGVSLTDDNGKMKSLNEMMVDLREGFTGLSEAEAAEMASALAGQEAMSGLLAIVNASDEDFNKLKKSIYNCDDAAAQMAETMSNNLQGQMKILQSGLEGLAISIYENMQDPCMEVVRTAQDMVQQLQSAFDDGGLDGLVAKVGDIFVQIVEKAASATPDFIEMASSLVQSFFSGIMDNLPAISDAGVQILTTLATALIENTGLLWSSAVSIFAELISGLAENMPSLIETAKSAITQFGESLIENAPTIGKSAAQIVSALSSAVVENMPAIIDAGKQIVHGFIEGIGEEFPALGGFLSGLFEGFTSTLEPVLEGIVSVVSGIFDTLGGADPATMEALGKALGTIAAAIVLMSTAKTATTNIKSLASTISTFAASVKNAIGIIPKLVEGFQLLSGGAGSFSEVLALEFPKLAGVISKIGTAFNTVQSVISSIGSIVAGVAMVIGGAIMAITNFFDMLKNGFSWIKEILMVVGVAIAAVGAVILGVPAAIAAAVAGIVAAVMTLVVVIKDHWDQIKEFFVNVGTAIADFFQNLPEIVGNVIDAIGTWFSELPGRVSTWLTETVDKIVAWGREMLTTARETASNVIHNVVLFFLELPNKIAYCLGYAIGTFIKWGIDLVNWVITEVPQIIENIAIFFSELPDKIWTWLVETINQVIQWGSDLYNTASAWVTNTIDNIVTFFSELPGNVRTWLVDTVNQVVQWGIDLLSAASIAVQNAINIVVEWFQQLPGKVWIWLVNTITKVTQFAANLAAKASSAAQGFVTKLVDGVKGLPDKFKEIGTNIVNGIWNGISSGWSWLVDKVKGLADSLFQGAKDALGISSPSKVFAQEVGQWIPPGIGVGVEKAMPDLQKQMDAEMEELANRMQTAVAVETGGITVRTRAKAEHQANTEYPQGGGDTYIDEHFEQTNNYHVPVPTPSETAKANREAARKLLGGVK